MRPSCGMRRSAMSRLAMTLIRDEIAGAMCAGGGRSEEHTSELQSPCNVVCRLLLEKKKPYGTAQRLACHLKPKRLRCGRAPRGHRLRQHAVPAVRRRADPPLPHANVRPPNHDPAGA